MSTSLSKGREGEALAAEYLRKKGYKIIAAGYRSRFGEIDLIIQKKKTIAFVEVKRRKNADYAPAYAAVTLSKQEKIKLTASQWTGEYGDNFCFRFDIVEIYTESGQITHIENAFI